MATLSFLLKPSGVRLDSSSISGEFRRGKESFQTEIHHPGPPLRPMSCQLLRNNSSQCLVPLGVSWHLGHLYRISLTWNFPGMVKALLRLLRSPSSPSPAMLIPRVLPQASCTYKHSLELLKESGTPSQGPGTSDPILCHSLRCARWLVMAPQRKAGIIPGAKKGWAHLHHATWDCLGTLCSPSRIENI